MFAGTVIRDDMGLTLEKVHKDMLGSASKVVATKDSTLIVTDGHTQEAVKVRVSQIQRLVEVCRPFSNVLKATNPMTYCETIHHLWECKC